MRSLLLLFILLPAPLAAQATLFRDVRLFDGASVHASTSVLVRDGRIAEVRQGMEAPAGAEVIDGGGRTLLPGLIDAHTHVFDNALREALVFGVTTEIDMFTAAALAQQYRREQGAGNVAGRADIVSAGTLATAPGGHGTEYGMAIPTITRADSAQAFVDARIAEGSDFIKIIYDDGSAFSLRWPSIDRATMRALVEAAHRRNVLAVVHVSSLQAARDAVDAGADALVHLFVDAPADDALVQAMKARGTFVVPTLTVLRSVTGTPGAAEVAADARFLPFIGPGSRALLAQSFPAGPGRDYANAQRTVKLLHAAGVRVLAGTDAPNPGTAHGIAMHQEVALLVEAGMSPVEALTAATSAVAGAFGLAGRGVVRPGARADLLLVEGDPTTDVRATRDIVGVWKGGARLDRAAYAAEVAVQVAGAAAPDVGSGLIADFEDGTLGAKFGTQWTPTTDSFAGGTSTGDSRVVDGGARGSARSLLMTGTTTSAVAYAWSGAMWSPGPVPMQPADLSATKGVTFWTKGDGGTYRVMVFSQGRGMVPLMQTFTAGAAWTERVVPWSAFGIDGSDVMAVMFVAGPDPRTFSFQVDDVRLH